MKETSSHLRKTLNSLYDRYLEDYHRSPDRFFELRRDPIIFPRRYTTFEDREAAAFLAATFAYGNVTSLCGFVEKLLGWMGPHPAEFLRLGEKGLLRLRSHEPYYRLHKTPEILALLKALSGIYVSRGSLYSLFLDGYTGNRSMREALSSFVHSFRSKTNIPKFLVPSPAEGSTCKRLNLFLRWMVRRQEPDLGLWRQVSPADLVMPVDTHIGRIAYRLNWIRTKSLSWQKAETITAILRELDPRDPTRYDFALCHESIARSHWLQRIVNRAERSVRL